jgi:hypothetical protein
MGGFLFLWQPSENKAFIPPCTYTLDLFLEPSMCFIFFQNISRLSSLD